MATRKLNEFLEVDASDGENEQGYDSEAAVEHKGSRLVELSSRASKKRKVHSDGDQTEGELEASGRSDVSEGEDSGEEELGQGRAEQDQSTLQNKKENTESIAQALRKSSKSSQKSSRPLSVKHLEKTARTARKTGVIYLSRIPPFMKPQTVRHLLSSFGTITKIFLTPESPTAHTQRTKSGGNKKRSFVDGWVEFSSKKDAKLCAETLNTQIVGGKKGGWYHDDVWNIKYLKGFKWHHLTEQIANENAERAARLRADISRVNRENKHFVQNVERAKMLEGMEGKRKKKTCGGLVQ